MINKNLVKQAMSEDLRPSGDITTRLLRNNKKIKAKIVSNQNCVVGGLKIAKEIFKYSDKKVSFKAKLSLKLRDFLLYNPL